MRAVTVAVLVVLTVVLVVFLSVYGGVHAASWQVVVPVVAALGLAAVAAISYAVEQYAPETQAEKHALKGAIDRFLKYRPKLQESCPPGPRQVCIEELRRTTAEGGTAEGTPERAEALARCTAEPTRAAACASRETQACLDMMALAHPYYRGQMRALQRERSSDEFLGFCANYARATQGVLTAQGY